jgi:hypothetical protein
MRGQVIRARSVHAFVETLTQGRWLGAKSVHTPLTMIAAKTIHEPVNRLLKSPTRLKAVDNLWILLDSTKNSS